ncbi:MAG: polyphosphate kinase 2 [Thermodesulfobacteriota bacterium]|nr:polyphosphate kinase 2 [Thermodesulfobacteriota bacterium]
MTLPKTVSSSNEAKKLINKFIKNIDKVQSHYSTAVRCKQILKKLPQNNKEQILSETLLDYYNDEELRPYQAELIKMQNHLERTGRKMIILVDGRGASGRGGTIRKITRYMNEKRYRVLSLGKPTESQKTELHIKRYIEEFPHAGEVVIFNRSWYNRAMIEPVLGYCTNQQYHRFLRKVVSYEENFILDAGRTILLKLYFSVSKEEQARRFEARKNDPLRSWKLDENDLQAYELWDEITKKKQTLLQKTHTQLSPWWIVRAEDKQLARRETIKLILNSVRYVGRKRSLVFDLDPEIIISGDRELRNMKAQKKAYGKSLY